ncbi:hypothetical protein C9J48_13825 [Photobacterium profundum]|uniref:Uncharacterized protein n=1 Tax=Photobacterium profundum 3TCK TaxID=314280 RepID=Q1Z6C7_9GAMM|nr:hypothetical protein [Photobacterium profundum]EAS44220.1 hypothetical protein P3TCK_11073 [Photobacterium profundum 3TCK]PSV62051.1 hypothetical protein C9J48_13825 [Photobacterium profundum]
MKTILMRNLVVFLITFSLPLFSQDTINNGKSIADNCREVGKIAQSFMTFRQMGMEYNAMEETLKATTKSIDEYIRGKVIFEDVFEYPIVQGKEEKQQITVHYSEYKAGECLMGYIK